MTETNEFDESNFVLQSEEERKIEQACAVAVVEVKSWIENVTAKSFAYPDDFRKSLCDGILLCNLLNCLKPGSIKRINKLQTMLAGYDNISKFLRCCEDDFGLSHLILFQTSDLEDFSDKSFDCKTESDKRLIRVLMCIFHLANSVEYQLTEFSLNPVPFNTMMKGQDLREIKRLRSNSNSLENAVESTVPRMIHNQNPEYLAKSAKETLSLTKKNQEILYKSVEDDEWQERLQNWREKRRQATSLSVIEDAKPECNESDNKKLIQLKEEARRMKEYRDKIKDLSIKQDKHKEIETPTIQNDSSIPNIDEETRMMIEKLKQKKQAEDERRKQVLSPTLSHPFGSDSEWSTSTTADRDEEKLMNPPEENQNDINDVIDNRSTSQTNEITIRNHDDKVPINNSAPILPSDENVKTRLVNIKLTYRSKQDREQLWGMEFANSNKNVVITKVKIGSCADVCELRKGDQIIKINNNTVTNKSVDEIISILLDLSSVISNTDYISLCIKRIIDEEDDFLSGESSDIDGEDNNLDAEDDDAPTLHTCVQDHIVKHGNADDSFNYTTISTAFESKVRKPLLVADAKLSEDESYNISVKKLENNVSQSESPLDSFSDLPNKVPTNKQYSYIPSIQNNVFDRNDNIQSPFTESSVTGFPDDKDKSIEIEISVTPQLFPIRNISLLTKLSQNGTSMPKTTETRPVDLNIEDLMMKSNCVKETDIDFITSPVQDEVEIDNSSSFRSNIDSSIPIKPVRVENVKAEPKFVSEDLSNADSSPDSTESFSSPPDYKSVAAKTAFSEFTSTVPVPSLYKNPSQTDSCSISAISSHPKSESNKRRTFESTTSTKLSKRSQAKDPNSLVNSKRSSSTKDLRIAEEESITEKPQKKKKKSVRYSDDFDHSYSTSKSSGMFQTSSQNKIHTKNYSIERPLKQVSIKEDNDKDKRQHSKPRQINNEKKKIKCNSCSQPVGSEDLMVIEELDLHFHLKCFVCNECGDVLGDGKSDTDVRIRRSKLHCINCYNKKSGKSKQKTVSSTSSRPNNKLSSNHGKGGNGDGNFFINAESDNCSISTDNTGFAPPSFLTNKNISFKPT